MKGFYSSGKSKSSKPNQKPDQNYWSLQTKADWEALRALEGDRVYKLAMHLHETGEFISNYNARLAYALDLDPDLKAWFNCLL